MKGELKVIKFLDDCNETQTHRLSSYAQTQPFIQTDDFLMNFAICINGWVFI